MADKPSVCANHGAGSVGCARVGRYACKSCFLVAYCGTDCQKSDWALHKPYCKSRVGKPTWKPSWTLENRIPTFIRGALGEHPGDGKYFWGNIPAFDVLQLRSNEGEEYAGDLKLLFAEASGDLRNMITTIAQIPTCYNGTVHVTINERDFDLAARNALILLIMLVVEDRDEAVECAIHVWYSAFIRKADLAIVQEQIRPLIESVCTNIKDQQSDALLGNTWTFGARSLRLTLDGSAWHRLLACTTLPKEMTAEHARLLRSGATLAASRRDYRDRNLLLQPLSRRVARQRFWEDGLLLPFAAQRSHFTEPNPTFFQNYDRWPMHDSADPLNGWSLREVEDTPNGPTKADIYGKLFRHVHQVLKAFLRRSESLAVSFSIFNLNATVLPNHLSGDCFTRIEVSNISDKGYLGICPTLLLIFPLLEKPSVNPHATLITLFMDTVEANSTDHDRMATLVNTGNRLLKYLPPKKMNVTAYDPDSIKLSYARDFVGTYDHIFDRFVQSSKLWEVAQSVGAAAKDNHTIIDKWPFRLKLQPGQAGAQEEFDRVIGSGVTGKELYMEWKRLPADDD